MKNNTIEKKIAEENIFLKKFENRKKFKNRKNSEIENNVSLFWNEVLVDEAEGRDAYVGRRPSEGEALATRGEGAVGTLRRV